jgi:cysteine desulfurase
MKFFPRKTIHLDYASTTPLDPEAFLEMKPYFTEKFYNPSSLYGDAVETKGAVEKSREFVARYLSCRSEEVIFTSGGTESSNIAIRGVLQAIWTKDRTKVPHVITTEFEHPATLEVCSYLESKGWIRLTRLSPNEHGVITPEILEAALTEETVLVSCIHVHNETGIIQPVRSLSRKIQKFKKEKEEKTDVKKSRYPVFHVDASQSPCYIKVQKESFGADLITLDASKFYGPKGIGVLFCKGSVPIEGVYQGGGQEKGLRPGTENVPGIVGFAKALEKAERLRESESARLTIVSDFFIQEIKQHFPTAHIHGEDEERSPHIVNVCFPGVDSEFLTIQLASAGVNVSFMTACKTSGEESISHSIQSFHPECAGSSIRFSFGRKTRISEIKKVIKILKKRVS